MELSKDLIKLTKDEFKDLESLYARNIEYDDVNGWTTYGYIEYNGVRFEFEAECYVKSMYPNGIAVHSYDGIKSQRLSDMYYIGDDTDQIIDTFESYPKVEVMD